MSTVSSQAEDRRFFVLCGVVSVLATAFLSWLIWFKPETSGAADLRFVPGLNACFNGLSATLLVSGYVAIRSGRKNLHRALMVLAFFSSTLFLVGYVAYHATHGDTIYEGPFRPLYLAILASHVLLSIALLPLCFTTLYFAIRKRFESHRKIARITLPIWLYVSVTGVVIFFMLHG